MCKAKDFCEMITQAKGRAKGNSPQIVECKGIEVLVSFSKESGTVISAFFPKKELVEGEREVFCRLFGGVEVK